MKHLVLIRHAKSDWSSPSLSDYDRPLNKRGRKDAPLMAEILKKRGIRPDLILSSPAKRALSTAELMREEFSLASDALRRIPPLYLGDLQDLASAVEETQEPVGTLFLVAHNPGISVLASRLSRRQIAMPTCCAVVFRLPGGWDLSSAEEHGTYRPKDFK